MEIRDDEIRRIILQALYSETERIEPYEPISVHDLREAIGIDLDRLKHNLAYLEGRALVSVDGIGVSLTEKAVWAIRQNERSYCPYL